MYKKKEDSPVCSHFPHFITIIYTRALPQTHIRKHVKWWLHAVDQCPRGSFGWEENCQIPTTAKSLPLPLPLPLNLSILIYHLFVYFSFLMTNSMNSHTQTPLPASDSSECLAALAADEKEEELSRSTNGEDKGEGEKEKEKEKETEVERVPVVEGMSDEMVAKMRLRAALEILTSEEVCCIGWWLGFWSKYTSTHIRTRNLITHTDKIASHVRAMMNTLTLTFLFSLIWQGSCLQESCTSNPSRRLKGRGFRMRRPLRF